MQGGSQESSAQLLLLPISWHFTLPHSDAQDKCRLGLGSHGERAWRE